MRLEGLEEPGLKGTPGTLESFGWQLDDLEIWDGLPEPGKDAESRPR